ncbi:MAG: Cell division protein FtsA [Verrucomicrobia subdivision 3 bacterium]|nr:Cell division protein FtsA [Limisphaerales bacterium]MCS1413828.1 Cell division protein FtsA [Limisphaerales bacterium]
MKSKSFLGIDFGAGSLKIAEFEPTESGGICLRAFGSHPLGLAGAQEAVREGVIKKAIQTLLSEQRFSSKDINVCAPGFHVFSKFVKLPPVDSSKVTQIIQYEAQQNVPFPLEEVVWDYQILGATGSGELEVLLVAIKTELVEKLFKTAESNNMTLSLVDVVPSALCNAFRYNYGDLKGCTMLLNIGAKTSNLLFFEGGKVYSRSINIGANAITQEFANESKIRFPDAEKFKIEEGFVSLGGTYEDPDNPKQAQISKIARQVMTRLHIQVNQTMQFYRSQQGGSAPQRLFLAGGASIMPYTAQFFAEKLNVEVEYFNPFRTIQIDPSLNLEELAKIAHSFGEVVGLGLRRVVQCPVELNLMPKSSLRRQEFNQKKPYFIATVFSLVLVITAIGWFFSQLTQEKNKGITVLNEQAQPLQALLDELQPEENALSSQMEEVRELTRFVHERYFWPDVLTEILSAILAAERETENKLGVDAGIWMTSIKPDIPGLDDLTKVEEIDLYADESGTQQTMWQMDREMMERYGLLGMEEEEEEEEEEEGILTRLNLVCKGVNRIGINQNANNRLAFELLSQLHSRTNIFDPAETKLVGDLAPVSESDNTFDFEVTITLANPLEL